MLLLPTAGSKRGAVQHWFDWSQPGGGFGGGARPCYGAARIV